MPLSTARPGPGAETARAIRIGTAGWAIPSAQAAAFPGADTQLSRYARQFTAVEINSSFYRPHLPRTYARWALSVPADFRFAVKAPREITHFRRLVGAAEPFERFLDAAQALGDRLGPVLLQTPPSLAFDPATAEPFFSALRARFAGAVACEPRHRSWFTDAVEQILAAHRIARVAADPAVLPRAAAPGGWAELAYWRWHGTPEMYVSRYGSDALARLAAALRATAARGAACWCIFDNTARGAALPDALALCAMLAAPA